MKVRAWDAALLAGLILLGGLIAGVCAGCSSGPQIPIQAPPTTVQIEAGACDRREALPETAGGELATAGPIVGGACNVVIWVDTNPSSSQVTRGVETGEVEVSPDTDVSLTGSP